MRVTREVLAEGLRTLRRDLVPSAGAPLLPLRGVRPPLLGWLPHWAIGALAVGVGVASGHTLIEDFDIAPIPAVTLAFVHAFALVLCLYWPMSGFWLSLGAATVTTVVAESNGSDAVWTEPSLASHLLVLALVGLRVRPRVLAEMWVLTQAAGLALTLVLPGRKATELATMAFLSAAVLVVAGALRARGEALRRLADQKEVAEAERARSALLEERARIARELHDVVAHHMSVVAIQAEAAPYRVAEPPDALVKSFDTIRANALDALAELRRVLDVLRADLPDEGAAPQPTLARLDDLVANVRAAGTAVTTTVVGDPRPLPPGVELSAYRIVQEALSNAMRHAPGSDVQVAIGCRATSVRVEVVNGPSPSAWQRPPAEPGHGLLGMRERAAMLGGTLSAGPQPGGGYAVTAILPIGSGEDA